MTVRVLLVYPGLDFEIAYPLGLAYVAAALRGAGHEITGYDAGLDGMSGLSDAIARARPEVIGLAVWSPNRRQAAEAAAIARSSGARLLIGGPHVTVDPLGALAELGADAAVFGEGEATTPALLAAWASGADPLLPGVALSDGRRGPKRAPAKDLDALPLADREVFDPKRYPHTWAKAAPRAASLVTSRGCPRACAHCPAPTLYKGRWRARAPAAVAAEALALKAMGFGHLLIEDEHPTVDRRRWLAVCAALGETGLSWSCPNGLRPETLDREVLAAMAAGGCTRFALGIETIDAARLKKLGRHADIEQPRRVVAWAREVGIDVTAYFMMGLPSETSGVPLRLLREATRLGVTGAHFSLFEPLPGSRLADAPPAPAWLKGARTGLYAGFYAHPGRLLAALRASGAGPADIPAALTRLRGWLRYGKRHAGLKRRGVDSAI